MAYALPDQVRVPKDQHFRGSAVPTGRRTCGWWSS